MNDKNRLSANTLFHFTEKEGLWGILKNGFYTQLCYENIHSLLSTGIKTKPDIAIPMVCFSDIPLSQMQQHIEQYGCYGIGLNKEWGMENKINPVLYFHPNSHPTDITNDFLANKIIAWIFYKLFSKIPTNNKDEEKSFISLSALLKAYQGFRYKNGKPVSYECVRFYNEREWRYIPKIEEIISKKLILFNDFTNEETQILINSTLKNDFKLNFLPVDVKYIIVKKESERSEIIEFIQNIKQRESEKQILISKIISSEQILNDF